MPSYTDKLKKSNENAMKSLKMIWNTGKNTDIQNKINNQKTRLEKSGIDVSAKKDKRNIIEKALNLKEDQNFLWDIAEIINRPQQALYGIIKNLQEGDNPLVGLKEGLTGEKRTTGAEIARGFGLGDESGFGIDDVLGFGLDVFADPLVVAAPAKLASIAGRTAKGVQALNAGMKATDVASDIAKGVKTSGTALETLRKGANVQKGIKTTANIAEKALPSNFNDILFGLTKKGVKKGFKIGDTAIEKILGATDKGIDIYKNKSAVKTVQKALGKGIDLSTQPIKPSGMLDTYRGLKELGKNTFNYAKTVPGKIANTIAEGSYNIDTFKDIANSRQKLFQNNKVAKYASSKNISIDEANKMITDVIESEMSGKTQTGTQLLKDLKSGKNIKLSEDNVNSVRKLLDDIGIEKYDITNNTVKLLKGNRNINDILGNSENINKLNNFEIKRGLKGLGYSDTELTYINKLLKDKDLLDLAKEQKLLYKQFSDDVYKGTKGAVNFESIINNPSYVRRALTENAQTFFENARKNGFDFLGNIKTPGKKISSRTIDLPSIVANRQFKEKVNADFNKIAKRAGIDINDKAALESFLKNNPEEMAKLTTQVLPGEKALKTALDTQSKLITKQQQIQKGLTPQQKILYNTQDKLLKKKATLKNLLKTNARNVGNNINNGKKIAKLESDITNLGDKLTTQNNIITDLDKTLNKSIMNVDNKIKRYKNIDFDTIRAKEYEDTLNKINYLKSKDGVELFDRSANAGFGDFTKIYSESGKSLKIMNDSILNTTFNNPSVFRIADTMDVAKKGSEIKISSTLLKNKLEKYKNILPEGSVDSFIKKVGKNDVIIDKNLYDLMSINPNKNDINSLLKFTDSINNTFKKFKVFTPGFQVRNLIGTPSNMYLSGIPAHKIASYQSKAGKILSRKEEIWNNGIQNIFKEAGDKDAFELLKNYKNAGFNDSYKELMQMAATEGFKPAKLNNMINGAVDEWYRMGIMMYAKDNPKYLQRLGVSNPVDAVKKVAFDPKNALSPNEKNIVSKIFPFYNFTKQNLMFQAENIMNNSTKYKRLMNAVNSTYTSAFGNDDEAYQKWQKEGFNIPLPFKDSKGNNIFIKANLPISDLGEFGSDPLRRVLSSATPLIKTPYEAISGIDTFTGLPKKDNNILGNLLGMTGLDTVTTKQFNKLSKVGADNTGIENLAALVPSVFQYGDVEKNKNAARYSEYEELNKIIKDLKNEGYKVPTITDIKRAQKLVTKIQKKRKTTY